MLGNVAMITLLFLHANQDVIRAKDAATLFCSKPSQLVHDVLSQVDPRQISTGFEILAETPESPIKREIEECHDDGLFDDNDVFITIDGLAQLASSYGYPFENTVVKWMSDILLTYTEYTHGLMRIPFC